MFTALAVAVAVTLVQEEPQVKSFQPLLGRLAGLRMEVQQHTLQI
jgi:hypothetical protein